MALITVRSLNAMIHTLREHLLKFGDPIVFNAVDNESCMFDSGSLTVRYVGPQSHAVSTDVAQEFGIDTSRWVPKNRDWTRMKSPPKFSRR